MTEVNFLFDNQLIAGVESIIKDSKKYLLLVSPYIDLDMRIRDALKEKILKHDFELRVLFGKNEDNYYRSVKKDSFEFLKQFPNIEIRYNERLHAKFYQNDFDFIMTSLNLYDYSLAKNIEVGVKGSFASKGIIGKAFNSADALLVQGVEKVKQDVLGMNQEVNPLEKFQLIFNDSTLLYKTEPNVSDKSGLIGIFGSKQLDGYSVILDNLTSQHQVKITKPESTIEEKSGAKITTQSPPFETNSGTPKKTQSASQLSKALGMSTSDITRMMSQAGLILGDKITTKGTEKGLVIKNYMGNDYIAYPDDLEELSQLKK